MRQQLLGAWAGSGRQPTLASAQQQADSRHSHAAQLHTQHPEVTCSTPSGSHLAQEDHALALEAAGQQDQHGAGGDRRPQLGGAADHAAGQRLRRILCEQARAGRQLWAARLGCSGTRSRQCCWGAMGVAAAGRAEHRLRHGKAARTLVSLLQAAALHAVAIHAAVLILRPAAGLLRAACTSPAEGASSGCPARS